MDRKSINKLPPAVGPSVIVSDINGPQGNTNPPLSPTTGSHPMSGYYNDSPVGSRDYDGPPGLSGSGRDITGPSGGAEHPYLGGDSRNSIPHDGSMSGRTSRGAADGGLPGAVFGPGNPNEPATSGRTARGSRDGGTSYPYVGGV